jgi:hypothetical protein
MVDTSRRAFIAATTSLAALSAPASALSAPLHDPGFLRCIEAHRRIERITTEWTAAVYDPAFAVYKAEKDAVPHYTTKASWRSQGGRIRHMTTSDESDTNIVMTLRDGGSDYASDDFGRCCAELRQALDDRNATLQRVTNEWLATRLNERSDWLGDEWFNAMVAVRDYPVRTLPDLILKVEKLQECEDDI